MAAFDPGGILNPGNLVPEASSGADRAETCSAAAEGSRRRSSGASLLEIDRESLLARADGDLDLSTAERLLNEDGLTLDALFPSPALTVSQWLAAGAPGSRDHWQDPADQLVAGLDATLSDGRTLSVRPAPRRSVGPDLTSLFIGSGERFGRIDRAWVRVHRRGVARPTASAFDHERDPVPSDAEKSLTDAVARNLRGD